MEKSFKISDSEWDVMEVLWKESPQTSKEIISKIQQNSDWKPTTIKTLISRLVDKNIINYQKKGKAHYYYPTLKREECIRIKSNRFIKKFYKGGLKAMIANFVDMYELSDNDIDDLKKILDKKKD
ncbi:BlaI/MecI/CopY family transcriptional regulator [Clostridiisalibacter paucivorans]|uniref:BlaI/MecI/CopY family transcriptional regulator n=1 Tax=Clostridiisalibacter paucivorans TaxID=408753 RepID=UPI00047A4903|nr:BlaI/MecI/CopY family transcriptional regulator [Clostridiisalibacter paucivorans]